jgi:D-arabinan exo alpha-(1,3)/(1,5)-arabinofuranosidase (non-reducing end)
LRYGDFGSSLRDLPRLRSSKRRRASSWDITGGNDDRLTVPPGAVDVLADIDGPGSISHIWCTVAVGGSDADREADPEVDEVYRRLLLRITWDGQDHPSVLVPLGDFFGVGHGRTVNFASAPLQMSPRDGRGFNSWFHMPFAAHATVELVSEMSRLPVHFYYYVDYETFDRHDDGLGYFHARWHRENPTTGEPQGTQSNFEYLAEGTNLTGDGNYVILDAHGRGHYVGCVLSIRNLRETDEWNWYGEGDDMIFIDGEPFPPSLHGTGTEDYFNTAWCPAEVYHAPYHGITLAGGDNWSGEISLYRFHIEDPITFDRSIRVTIEHGHANKRSDDVSSVAYWYQTLPHEPFGILPVERRLLRP